MTKAIVVVIDERCDEALYVDGLLASCDGGTVYACDIATAAMGQVVTIKHTSVMNVVNWPQRLADLRPQLKIHEE